MLNSLDPNQAIHFVGPVLDSNGLQMLSADDTSTQRVKVGVVFESMNTLLSSCLGISKISFIHYI